MSFDELIAEMIQRRIDDIREYIKLGWDKEKAIAKVKDNCTLGPKSWEKILEAMK